MKKNGGEFAFLFLAVATGCAQASAAPEEMSQEVGRPRSEDAVTASCPQAGPITVAENLRPPVQRLVVDDQFVYYKAGFFETGPGETLERVAKAGGAPELLAYAGRNHIGSDTDVDGGHAYFLDFGADELNAHSGGLFIFDKASGSIRRVEAQAPTECHTIFLQEMTAAGDGTVYWLQRATTRDGPEDPNACLGTGLRAIARVDPGATQPVIVFYPSLTAKNLKSDSAYIYWSDDNAIWRLPRSGGAPEVLAASDPISDLALDPTHGPTHAAIAYFAVPNGPTGGGAGTYAQRVVGFSSFISATVLGGLTTDGTFLYGIIDTPASATGSVTRMKQNGHGQIFLARGATNGGIAIDESFIYYVDPDQTTIQKVCRNP